MRNRTMILIISIALVVAVILCLAVNVPNVGIPLPLVFVAIVIAALMLMWIITLIAKSLGPMLVWDGGRTSLVDSAPYDTCTVKDEKENKVWDWDLYLKNGCKAFNSAGGHKDGCIVVRHDITEKRPGNMVNVLVLSVPEYYMLEADPDGKYRDLSGLPREVYEMVTSPRNKFHEAGPVGVIWGPIKSLNNGKKEDLNCKTLMEAANTSNLGLRSMLNATVGAGSRVATAHKAYVDHGRTIRTKGEGTREARNSDRTTVEPGPGAIRPAPCFWRSVGIVRDAEGQGPYGRIQPGRVQV